MSAVSKKFIVKICLFTLIIFLIGTALFATLLKSFYLSVFPYQILLIATVTLLLVAVICVQATNGEQHRAEGFKRSRRRSYVACAQGSCEYCRSGTYGGITNSSGNYCCPTTNTDSGWFPHADSAASFWHTRDYCTGLPVGQPCVTDAMCGDGSPGSCSGDLGWRGHTLIGRW